MAARETRRHFLHNAAQWAGVMVAAMAVPRRVIAAPVFVNDPFQLGVASGDPTADGFVLWTRLAPDPLDPQALPSEAIAVGWEIASDAGMKKIVAHGNALAHPELAHSVHVDVSGLLPAREYFYRFRAGSAVSRIGRTVTWPTPRAPANHVRFAVASCQSYEEGYFSAYRDMVAQNPDFILHLGDYIYETAVRGATVRHAPVADAYTLDEYRLLHAVYKTDPDLQAAHAHCPWLYMWDDHEVANDYARDQAEKTQDTAVFLKRRIAAYQAVYEHMPLRISARADANGLAYMYQRLDYGDLAAFSLLDQRQFRDRMACQTATSHAGKVVDTTQCTEVNDPKRTMLGETQEKWFATNFIKNQAAWNVIAQTLMLSALDQTTDAGYSVFTDSWGGYAAARRKVLDLVRDKKVPNTISLGGDIHSYFVSDIRDNDKDSRSPILITEFVGTSITSESNNYALYQGFMPKNPQIRFFDDRSRGYMLCDISRETWKTTLRTVDTVRVRDGKFATLKTFVVENGKSGAQAG